AAIARFDVGIVPYVMSAYTASVAPTKVGEYLAMGKPVVSTPLPRVVEMERESGGVVTTGGPRPAEFLACVERMLESARDPATAAGCREVAERYAWSRRIEEISAEL